jgi:hypothetical protein
MSKSNSSSPFSTKLSKVSNLPSTYTAIHILLKTRQCITNHKSHIFTDAFPDDPFSTVLLGGDLSLAPAEFDAQIRATLIGGAVHALMLGPAAEDIVGVALWYPPGKSLFATCVLQCFQCLLPTRSGGIAG